jgi:hypothetical protein
MSSVAATTSWQDRVGAVDWAAVRAGLDRYGCGLTGPLLTAGEAAGIAALYTDDSRFRSTVTMASESPRPSCSGTAKATGTHCTVTSTAISCSRCRS